jgi:hypothetical protein
MRNLFPTNEQAPFIHRYICIKVQLKNLLAFHLKMYVICHCRGKMGPLPIFFNRSNSVFLHLLNSFRKAGIPAKQAFKGIFLTYLKIEKKEYLIIFAWINSLFRLNNPHIHSNERNFFLFSRQLGWNVGPTKLILTKSCSRPGWPDDFVKKSPKMQPMF